MEEEAKRKDLQHRVVAKALKTAKPKNKALKAKNEKIKTQTEGLIDYYYNSESKMKALRLELDEAKAAASRAVEEAASSARALAQVMESVKQASYMPRLALNDLRANANGALGKGASTLEFSEWSQEAGGGGCRCYRELQRLLCPGGRQHGVVLAPGAWLRAHRQPPLATQGAMAEGCEQGED